MTSRLRDRFTTFSTTEKDIGSVIDDVPIVGYCTKHPSMQSMVGDVVTGAGGETLYSVSGIPIVFVAGGWGREMNALRSAHLNYVASQCDTVLASKVSYFDTIKKRVSYVMSVQYEQMADTPSSRFKTRSSQGEVIMKPMRLDKYSFTCPVRTVESTRSAEARIHSSSENSSISSISGRIAVRIVEDHFGMTHGVMNHVLDLVSTPLMDPTNAINAAYSNMSSADLDLPVIYGEKNETLSHLGTTVRRVAEILRALRSGNFKRLAPKAYNKMLKRKMSKPPSDILADAWLEARYAWRPLIGDAEVLIEKLCGSRKYTPRQTFRSSRLTTSSDEIDTSYSETIPLVGTNQYEVHGDVSILAKAGAGFLCELSAGGSTAREFGLLNPFGVAWELVPYSFIIDRFLNIRSLIGQMALTSQFHSLGSWVTQHTQSELVGEVTMVRFDGKSEEISFSCSKTSKVRSVNVSPKFVLKLDINLDVPLFFDAITLLWRLR